MSKTTALEKVRQTTEDTALDSVQEKHTQQDMYDVHLSFGALGGLRLVGKFVGVSTIKVLQQVRDREQYKSFGFSNFKDFLEESPLAQQYAGISYRTFNNLENQMKEEGDQLYDLLNQFNIPISTRQFIAKTGEIEITLDGDDLKIGDESFNLQSTELGSVKTLIKDLAKETRKNSERAEKAERVVNSLKEQVKTGQAEYEEARRSIDAQTDGTKYEQAFKRAFGAMVNLTLAAKDSPIVERDHRGETDIQALWEQMKLYRSAMLQDNFVFTEEVKTEKKSISKRAVQALAEDDDFGDENEGE